MCLCARHISEPCFGELIEFGVWTRVGPSNHVLSGVRILLQIGALFGGGRHAWACLGVTGVNILNILNIIRKGAAAVMPVSAEAGCESS